MVLMASLCLDVDVGLLNMYLEIYFLSHKIMSCDTHSNLEKLVMGLKGSMFLVQNVDDQDNHSQVDKAE